MSILQPLSDLFGIGRGMERDLIERGVGPTGEFEPSFLQKQFIREEELPRLALTALERNPEVLKRVAKGIDAPELGDDLGTYISRTQGDYDEAVKKKRLEDAEEEFKILDARPGGGAYQRGQQEAREAYQRGRDRFNDDLTSIMAQGQLANQTLDINRRYDAKRDDLEQRRYEVGLQEQLQREKMDIYRQQLENQRVDRNFKTGSSLASALALLGSAFAL